MVWVKSARLAAIRQGAPATGSRSPTVSTKRLPGAVVRVRDLILIPGPDLRRWITFHESKLLPTDAKLTATGSQSSRAPSPA